MTSPNAEKSEAIKKADEVGQVMCNVIAPSDGDKLFQAVVSQYKGESGDEGLQVLVAETQIVRIYASRFTAGELKEIHRPFENVSHRQIKKARTEANIEGLGLSGKKILKRRIRIDQRKLDHFLEFTMRPANYQDVTYGGRTIKPKSSKVHCH